MEIEKLIEALGDLEMCAYGYHINGEVLGMDCTDFECLMADAAEEISKIPALQAENDRLKEEVQQMQWIPVEERLPKPEFKDQQRGFYLVTLSNGVVKELIYEFRHYDNMLFDVGWHDTAFPVTHWMPLPEAPKEG